MTCEETRSTIRASGDGEWPPEVTTHLSTCDACIEAAIDLTLRQRPSTSIPAAFAVDVTRRARVEAANDPIRPSTTKLVLTAAALSALVPLIWLATTDPERAAIPLAALLLALAEGIVLFAWTMQSEVVRPRFRP